MNSNLNKNLENIDLINIEEENNNYLDETPSNQTLPKIIVKKNFTNNKIEYIEEDIFEDIDEIFKSDEPVVISSNDDNPLTSVVNQVISKGYIPPTLEEIKSIQEYTERIGRFYMKKAYPVISELNFLEFQYCYYKKIE